MAGDSPLDEEPGHGLESVEKTEQNGVRDGWGPGRPASGETDMIGIPPVHPPTSEIHRWTATNAGSKRKTIRVRAPVGSDPAESAEQAESAAKARFGQGTGIEWAGTAPDPVFAAAAVLSACTLALSAFLV